MTDYSAVHVYMCASARAATQNFGTEANKQHSKFNLFKKDCSRKNQLVRKGLYILSDVKSSFFFLGEVEVAVDGGLETQLADSKV